MTAYRQSFKSWVPRWIMLVTILLTLIPVGSVLGIYLGGISSAMSYYGVDSLDIRFSIVLYYLAIASGFPLEKKFFNRFASKPYLTACMVLFIGLNLTLYFTRSFELLLVLRFLGGLLSLAFIGTLFTLIFQQFHSQRTRVLGYAVLYGTLLGSAPLSYLIDAFVFSNHDFNALFMLQIFLCLPGFLLLLICLQKKVELRKEKGSIRNIDWTSFILYAASLTTVAYVLCYGQYYGWFHSMQITLCTVGFVILLMLFYFRQRALATPFIDLSVYRYKNFRIGMILLVTFYLAKGDTSVANGFFANAVNLDVYHKSYVMLVNGLGIVIGAGLAARFVLAKQRIRLIWLTGFGALLGYHVYMLFLLGHQAETSDVLFPLFLQGFGNGTLILSIVIFYVTGVPQEIGFSASVTGVSYRFFSFTASMALIIFMGLRQNSVHYHRYAEDIVVTNTDQTSRVQMYQQKLKNQGASSLQASAGASRLLGGAVRQQTDLLFARDYYFYMSCFIIVVMLIIAVIPHFHYYLRKIGDKLIPI